jgi:hypothetical protein
MSPTMYTVAPAKWPLGTKQGQRLVGILHGGRPIRPRDVHPVVQNPLLPSKEFDIILADIAVC